MMIASAPLLLLTGLVIGAVAGFVMHRSEYCLSGAFRDIFLFGNALLLRSLALLVAVSMVLFEGARRLGWLAFHPFPLLGSPTPANAVGGALFGVGMVLSGGCVVGSLYKLGAGRLVQAATILGLVAGSAVFADLYPGWKAVVSATSFFPGRVTVPQLLGVDPAPVVLLAVVPSVLLFLRWRREGKWIRAGRADGYLQPWIAAILLALAGLGSCVAAGMPMGVTTTYAKAAGLLESLFGGELVTTHPYFGTFPLDAVNPITGASLRGGPAPVWDSVALIQVPLIAGIVLGSALSARSLRELAPRWNVPPRQFALAFGGGVLMGLASRMGAGCNVWHLLGGVPIFAMSSILFAAGIFPGAWIGGRVVSRIL